MTRTYPDIVKLAERTAVAIEKAVSGFPRSHRYTHGSVIRLRAMGVCEASIKAWQSRGQQADSIAALSEKIDALKLSLRVGKQLAAFRSAAEFAAIYTLARDLGRQCGGWLKHVKGQNPQRQLYAAAERPSILSARDAQQLGANP